MKPTFLLETDTFDDGNPEKMADILTTLGINWSYVKYVPVFGDIQFVKPSAKYHRLAKHYVENGFKCPADDIGEWLPTIFYGSLNCAKYLQRTYEPTGLWLDLKSFRCQNYFVHYGKYLLSQRYMMMPVEEIMRNADDVFGRYSNRGIDGQVFIRPDDGDKPFNGEVVCREKLDEWYRYTSMYDDPEKNIYKLAVVATPVPIEQEWRLVVYNGKVVTGSQYRKIVEGRFSVEIEEGYSPDAAAYAENIVAETKWTPHPIFVMDIALSQGEIKLVEIGSVNTCGLYACDIAKVVDAMLLAGELGCKAN